MTKRIVLKCKDVELSGMVCPRPSYWVNNKYVRSHTIIGIVLRLFWYMHLGQNRHRNFAVE